MKLYNTYPINENHEGLTVEAYLKQILGYSGRQIQKITHRKGLMLNRKQTFLKKIIKSGDILKVIILRDLSYGVTPEQGSVEILYQDEYLIILNKPAGLLVHPTGQTSQGTLSNFLAYYYRQQGIVCTIRPLHRLDRETSGCIIFAKDSHTQTVLEGFLMERTLKRTYQAVVTGFINPPTGTIDAPIGSHPKKPNRRAVNSEGESAITHYKTLRNLHEASLLELSLETGRTHQIRVHLAYIGHPILGDRMYGKASALTSGQALHACSVRFPHPVESREIEVKAPLPEHFLRILECYSSEKPLI